MEELHKKNPNVRRKSPLSRTKLLCAAGLTFCDFSSIDAAKAEGHPNNHDVPGSFLPVIHKNETINDLHLDKVTNPAHLGSDLDEMSDDNQQSMIQRGTSIYPRTIDSPIGPSDTLPQTLLGPDRLSDSPRLPRPPPPPQWIRENRYEHSQTNNRQPINRHDPHESMIRSNVQAPPSTRKYNRDNFSNASRDEKVASPNFTQAQQRRVPLYQQHAASEQRQYYYPTQQQQQVDVSSNKSNQFPRAFRSIPQSLSHPEGSQSNNRHARSYQSRIMQHHPEQQQASSPESRSSEYSRTGLEQPLNRDRWSRKVVEQQHTNHQAAASLNRSGFRSLRREPMTNNQYNSDITMNIDRPKKMTDHAFPSETRQAMDDPNGSFASLVPRPSHSQLAVLTPSYNDVILDDRINQVQSLVEAGAWLSFGSIQKISWCLLAISLLSYAAVSPSSLPLTEYNLKFYENFRLVCLSTIAPAIYMLFVFDPRENDVNTVTNVFVVTFFFGYTGIYILELIATTIVRLLLFVWLEPNVFSLTPNVPLPVLPWVLRDWQYRPKRITLLSADLGTSCIACPIIEECVKFFLLQRICKLPRNFNWAKKENNKRKNKRRIAEIIRRENGEYDCTSANQYVTNMLAISVALKLADAARRILLYTKGIDANKGFYAICRGIFPIHELCGAMIAIALAKRDLLGVDVPRWKILAPAIVVHAMANFRGKRPIFKWSASSPWSEMQLSPLNIPDSSTFLQLVKKGYAKLMWIVTISRVYGYCVKNYYMVNRHALKRTTTYAGNHAAFSAELVTAESLKNLKKSR